MKPSPLRNWWGKEEWLTDSPPEYLSVSQAAQALSVSIETIRRWTDQNKLRCMRTKGNHRRIPLNEVLRLRLAKQAEQSSPVQDQGRCPPVPALPLPRHTLKAFRAQLKVLQVLFSTLKPQESLLVIEELITLVTDVVENQALLKALKPSCYQFQAALMQCLADLSLLPNKDEEAAAVLAHLPVLKKKKTTVFEQARKKAPQVFYDLVKASTDKRLDREERQRASELVGQILEPYTRLTSYLALFSPGTVEHDVCYLLLTKHPLDYGKSRRKWSVRLLSEVCQEHLGTKSASKSQVGRFYKRLGWHQSITRKLLSPDPLFGEKMKRIGKTLAQRTADDLWVVGDEFKFTSSKTQEYLMPTHAPAGLHHHVQERFDLYYRPICTLEISGLYDPQTKRLETEQLPTADFNGYLTTLTALAQRFLPSIQGTLYIGLDNGSIHRPELLQDELQKLFGDRVEVMFFPTYSPNTNPLERVWQQLLNAVVRLCTTEEELQETLTLALKEQFHMSQAQLPPSLQLTCPICHHTFAFDKTPDVSQATQVEKHLCFTIPNLNPYVIQVLTHSLDIPPSTVVRRVV